MSRPFRRTAEPEQVIAFDTGPGNMVIDQLVAIHTRNRRKYDSGGQIAARGKVNQKLLDSLLRRTYYRQPPPKTAGREQYGQRVRARSDPDRGPDDRPDRDGDRAQRRRPSPLASSGSSGIRWTK